MKLTFCAACSTMLGLEHHHLRPKVRGGSDVETNLITLCRECHGKMHGNDWWNGIFWNNDHRELQRAGIERARAEGKYKGKREDTARNAGIAGMLRSGMSWSAIQAAAGCSRTAIAKIAKRRVDL